MGWATSVSWSANRYTRLGPPGSRVTSRASEQLFGFLTRTTHDYSKSVSLRKRELTRMTSQSGSLCTESRFYAVIPTLSELEFL